MDILPDMTSFEKGKGDHSIDGNYCADSIPLSNYKDELLARLVNYTYLILFI